MAGESFTHWCHHVWNKQCFNEQRTKNPQDCPKGQNNLDRSVFITQNLLFFSWFKDRNKLKNIRIFKLVWIFLEQQAKSSNKSCTFSTKHFTLSHKNQPSFYCMPHVYRALSDFLICKNLIKYWQLQGLSSQKNSCTQS